MSADDLVAMESLLQPVALAVPLVKRCAAAATCCPRCAPGCSRRAGPRGRARPAGTHPARTLVTLIASVAAVYLWPRVEGASLGSVLHKADSRWGIAALALSAATYVAATEALIGSSPGS